MSEEEKLLREAKKLPWEDRLFHKNWKVRNEANVDLASVCDSVSDPRDPRLREFGPFFKKTLADSNAPVQEKALDALIAFLRAADADADAGRYAKDVCDVIVAKCLSGRPKTVEKSQAAFMLWVELEAVEAFLDAMEKAIRNKVAKAVVPAIDVIFQALRNSALVHKNVNSSRSTFGRSARPNSCLEAFKLFVRGRGGELCTSFGQNLIKLCYFLDCCGEDFCGCC